MKKLLLFLIVGMFMLSFTSALTLSDPSTWDDQIKFHETSSNGKYGYYEIADTFLWIFNKKQIKTVELIENDYSIFSAWNIKQIELFESTKLFDKTDYYGSDKKTDRSDVIKSQTQLYRQWVESTEEKEIQTTCNTLNTITNETSSIEVCTDWNTEIIIKDNSHWTDWEEYNWGSKQPGLYQTKTIVTRDFQNTGVIDWIDTSEGHQLKEWAAWWNSSWTYNKEYTNLTGNITYMFINATVNDNSDFNDTRFVSCYTSTLVFNHTLEAKFGTFGQFRVNNLGENCTLRYYGNSGASSTSNASDVYFEPLSAYYLDENANDSINGNDGTVNGPVLTTGYINNSYSFDGVNDHINLNTVIFETAGGSQDYSFFAWVNSNNIEQNKALISQFSGGAVNNRFQFGFDDSATGYLRYSKGGVGIDIKGNVDATTTGWHCVGFVKSSGTVDLYVDGVSTGSGADGNPYENSNTFIGSSTPTGNPYNGSIDEPYIYERALTLSQIKSLCTQTEPNFIEGNETLESGVITELLTPLNNSGVTSTSVNFSVNSSSANFVQVDNVTLSVWNATDNSLVVSNFSSLDTNTSVVTNWTNALEDGNYIWNAETCGTGVDCRSATTNRTFTVHTISPTVNITNPSGNLDYIRLGDNQTLNYNISELGQNLTEHLDQCWYNYNGVNNSLNCSGNTSSFTYIQGINNITVYANDSFGLFGSNTSIWDYKIVEINQTFNNITTEGATEQFIINFVKSSSFQVSTVALFYNGTSNSFPYSVSGDNVISQGNIIIPVISSDMNVTFYWNITLNDGSNIITDTNNQTILSINVDNCSSFTNIIYNFTQYDEENKSILGGNNTIELQINLFDTKKTLLLANFSNKFENINPVQFCTESPILTTVNYSAYVVVKYFLNSTSDSKSYSVEYYNILNQTVGNTTIPINVALYNLKVSDTTKFRLTFRNEEYVLAPNILVQVHRQYIQDNSFTVVEIPLTDSNGQTVLNLVKDVIIYNFVMVNEAGEVVGTFNSIAAFCSDSTIGDCRINLAPDSLSEDIYDYDEEFDISISDPSYDNSTKKISMSFVTGDLTPKNVRMEIIRNNDFGNRSVCSDSLFSASGVLSCNVSSIVDTDQFLFISTTVEGDLAKENTINLNSNILNFGTLNGAFYAFFFILILITLFMEDRKTLVISLGLGWVGVISLGLINGKFIGATSAGIWILISIMIFLWKLTKEDSA